MPANNDIINYGNHTDKYIIARFIRAYITSYHTETEESHDWIHIKITNFINIAPDEIFTLEDKGLKALKACIDYINSYDSEYKDFYTLWIDKWRFGRIYQHINE